MRIAARSLFGFTFALALSLPALAAPPKSLESTPQAKVYRANAKALAAGDIDAYRKTMSSEAVKQMDEQDKQMKKTPKEIMEFMKMISPTDIQITDVKVNGKKATLSLTGKLDGQMKKGTADEVEENGQWKVGQQSWSNAK